MPRPSLQTRFAALYVRVMLAVACLWFAQLYAIHPSYIQLARYAAGMERMPFQGRDLMRWPLLAAGHSSALQRLTAGRALLHSPEMLVDELVAAASLYLAGMAAVRLYRLALPEAPLPALPFALLIVVCLFDFVLTVPYSFPYDLPATALTGWCTYLAMRRCFWRLLPLFALGTWNRETILFVVGVVLTTALVRSGRLHWSNLRLRDAAEIGALFAVWIAITTLQKHAYAGNPSEAGSRIAGNLHVLRNPLLWTNVLSASGFLLPYIFLLRSRIAFAPLQAAMFLLPFWILLLLSFGQILELRIYGDISVPVAVAAAVILVGQIRPAVPRSLTQGASV